MNNSTKRIWLAATGSLIAVTAHAELVVIVNAKNSTTSMTAAQVSEVYLGKDATLSPVDLPASATQRDEFYQKVAGKDSAQVKAIWARLIFSGKSQPPKEVGSSAEAVKQVASNDKAIAYVDKSAVDGSVKAVLSVN